MLSQNPAFLEAWELVKLERFSFAQLSPEARCLFSMVTTGMAVAQLNKLKAIQYEAKANNSIVSKVEAVANPPSQPPAAPSHPAQSVLFTGKL